MGDRHVIVSGWSYRKSKSGMNSELLSRRHSIKRQFAMALARLLNALQAGNFQSSSDGAVLATM
jgi:hypothetical protein